MTFLNSGRPDAGAESTVEYAYQNHDTGSYTHSPAEQASYQIPTAQAAHSSETPSFLNFSHQELSSSGELPKFMSFEHAGDDGLLRFDQAPQHDQFYQAGTAPAVHHAGYGQDAWSNYSDNSMGYPAQGQYDHHNQQDQNGQWQNDHSHHDHDGGAARSGEFMY